VSFKDIRYNLAARISPELAEEAEEGMYLHMLLDESRNYLREFRPIRRTLERIRAVCLSRYRPGVEEDFEPNISRFRDDLWSEQKSVTHDPDPALERLYADAVMERDKLEELLAANNQLLDERHDWKAKYLATQRPVEDEVVVDLDAEDQLVFAS
jgi:hypothetical protein